MAAFAAPSVRARVWYDGRMVTPEDAAREQFVLFPTGGIGQIRQDPDLAEPVDAPRLYVLDGAVAMLSTLSFDADRCEVFVGDVVEEPQTARRYVVQHGYAVVSEFATLGFFGAPLGTLERRLLRISDNLGYFRIIGTVYDDDFETVRASTP